MEVDLSAVIRSALDLAQPGFDRARLQVETEVPEHLAARANPDHLAQVLANLLENASRYTPPGTPITLSAQMAEHEVTVSVEDSGPGLPAGDPELLFAKFHRGATESAVGGVGLGLAICRAVVNLHAGRIWAERKAQGAAFRFTLPLEAAPGIPAE